MCRVGGWEGVCKVGGCEGVCSVDGCEGVCIEWVGVRVCALSGWV